MKPVTSPLDGSEWALLRERIATVQALVTRRYSAAPFDQSPADLDVLQRVLDDNVYDEGQVDELSGVGAVFGNVVLRQLGFEWVATEDARGNREPALRLKPTGALVVRPIKLILDGVRAGSKPTLTNLVQDIKKQAAGTRLI